LPVKKLSGGMLVWICVWVKCRFAYGPADATATPDRFYFPGFTFWCWLTRVVLDKIQEGHKTVVCVCASAVLYLRSFSSIDCSKRPAIAF